MTRELKMRVMNLPPEDRKSLANDLIRSLDEPDPATPRTRFDELVAVIETVGGGPLDLKSRDSVAVWRRAVVAYQLILEGYSESQVGRLLQKDHSTVHHMKRNMENAIAMPGMYRDVIWIWNKFKELI